MEFLLDQAIDVRILPVNGKKVHEVLEDFQRILGILDDPQVEVESMILLSAVIACPVDIPGQQNGVLANQMRVTFEDFARLTPGQNIEGIVILQLCHHPKVLPDHIGRRAIPTTINQKKLKPRPFRLALFFRHSRDRGHHNGRSYIFFQMNQSPVAWTLNSPSQIGMVGVLPENSTLQNLTPDADTVRMRMDPEYYITSQGPFIYYNRFRAQGPASPGNSEGVWRVDTGLGPALSPLRQGH